FLLREEAARLQLEQRGDEDEELAVDLEILSPLGEEGQDDLDDLDVSTLGLFLQDEGEQEVEWALEGVEIERELCHGAHRQHSMFSGGRGLSARSSSAPGAEPWASASPTSRTAAA